MAKLEDIREKFEGKYGTISLSKWSSQLMDYVPNWIRDETKKYRNKHERLFLLDENGIELREAEPYIQITFGDGSSDGQGGTTLQELLMMTQKKEKPRYALIIKRENELIEIPENIIDTWRGV